ncbi:helix-turn-helix domain-containing protein [Thiorhodococcus minor]|uniref:Helix-turn-helix domain-containing protein n=1 Tax=Thiorhodococcus minor TaxID=57489 RepID=A0A6M0K6Y4_9GAMM|nr:helix-turn-helix domain-containing protein [Thiorhodococcus minor]NEV65014.1 helix-turn-helix domain-containing protein [Thiorhodococcus minor]
MRAEHDQQEFATQTPALKAIPTQGAASSVDAPTLFEGLQQRLDSGGASASCAQVSGVPSARTCALGRVGLLKATGETLSLTTQGSTQAPGVTALILVEGAARVAQGGRETALGAGDLCLMRTGKSLELSLSDSFRAAFVEAPEAEIADRFPLWRAAMLTQIPGKNGVSAVFCDAIRSMHHWRESLAGEGGERLADVVIDLMGALVCFAVPINGECVRQSLYQKDQVKKVIQLNLRNPELSVELIAESVGMSPRQIHRLFLDEGISIMRWVWTQRLEQCYRELLQSDSAHRSISDIAYTWGFNDSSHFSRAFRKHFGVSPSQARRRGLAAEPQRVTV